MTQNITTLFGNDITPRSTIKLDSEDDAWIFLESLLDNKINLPNDIVFGNWVNIQILLKGTQWKSSITPSIFPLFNEIQRTVNRAYAQAKYNNKKHNLTKEEKEKLDIIIQVSDGSSIIETIIDLKELAKAALDKMDSKHLMVSIVIIALVIGGSSTYKHHVETAKEIRLAELNNSDKKVALEALNFAGSQETDRMKIIYKHIENNELAKSVYEDSENIHHEMLKAATKADISNIEGVNIDNITATELLKSKRVKPEPMQINGFFEVLKIEWHESTIAGITMKRVSDGITVNATFDLAWFNEDDKKTIKNAEWEEQKPKIINAHINARQSVDGRIVNAELVRVSAPTDTDFISIKEDLAKNLAKK